MFDCKYSPLLYWVENVGISNAWICFAVTKDSCGNSHTALSSACFRRRFFHCIWLCQLSTALVLFLCGNVWIFVQFLISLYLHLTQTDFIVSDYSAHESSMWTHNSDIEALITLKISDISRLLLSLSLSNAKFCDCHVSPDSNNCT